MNFVEALRTNTVYLCNGRVHACKTRKALELNIGHEGIKWLMVEAAARHAEVVHYSTSAEMRVGSDDGRKTKDFGFWPLVLEGVTGVRLRKEESNHTERRVREVTRWHDPVDEKTGFMEAACQIRRSCLKTNGLERPEGRPLRKIRHPEWTKEERWRSIWNPREG